jgi:hypothetical protein
MKIMAFKGFGNIETFSVSKDGELFDLSAAGFTSARVYADRQYVEATVSGSELGVVLGDLQVGVGCYNGKVVVYSDLYPDGLVIMGQGLPEALDITVKE